MAYQDTSYLSKKVESLRKPFEGGLIQAVRNYRADKADKRLTEIEKQNEANRAQELAMLLRGAETGRVGDFMGAARLDQAKFTDPTIQSLAAELRLKKASEKPMEVSSSSRLYDPTSNKVLLDAVPDLGTGGSMTDMGRYMAATPEERKQMLEFRRNPYLDMGNERLNTLTGEGIPMGLRPGETPVVRGQQAAAVEGAETSAIEQRIPLKLRELEQSGQITSQQRIALEQQLSPIMVSRTADEAAIGTTATAREGVIKGETERYYEAIPKAEAAANAIRSMDQFIAASPGSPEGSLAGVVTGVKNVIASLGGNPEGLTESALMESARAGSLAALMNQMGARTMSEGDRIALEKALPNIATSQEARVAVANVIKANAQRALAEFSQLDDARRADPMSGKYMMPLPWLEDWKRSSTTSGNPLIDAADRILRGN